MPRSRARRRTSTTLEMAANFDRPYDSHGAIVTIRAGRGRHRCGRLGRDARAHVSEVGRRTTASRAVADESPGEEAGLRSVTFFLRGKNAYGMLESERGVHRLVRISPFDQQHRRQTSFAEVDVVPEIEEGDVEDIEIRPEDLRVETFKASGAGGQYVNKTESAMRIIHVPTNTIVASQQERSQMQNRDVAMNILRAKIVAARTRGTRSEARANCAANGAPTSGVRRSARTCSIRFSSSKITAPSVETGNTDGGARGRHRAVHLAVSAGARAPRAERASLMPAAHRRHRRLLERQGEDRDRARFGVRAARSARRSGFAQRRRFRQRFDRRQPRVHCASATAGGSTIVENGANLGFAAACNRAFAATSAPVCLSAQPRRGTEGRRARDDRRRSWTRIPAAASPVRASTTTTARSRSRAASSTPGPGRSCARARGANWPPFRARIANGAALRGFGTTTAERRVDLAIGAALAIRRTLHRRRSARSTSVLPLSRRSRFRQARRRRGLGNVVRAVERGRARGHGQRERPVQRRSAQTASRRKYWIKHHGYAVVRGARRGAAGRYLLYLVVAAAR